MSFQTSILEKITTSDTTRPTLPQIKIKNPLDAKTVLNGILLILSPEFSKKGKLIIDVNNVTIFDENDSEAFEGFSKFAIPLGIDIKRGRDIKIFAWNSSGDAASIKVSANVSISENPESFNGESVPLGRDVFNQSNSQDEILVTYQEYSNESVQKEIEMTGYENVIVKIPSAFISWIVDSSDFPAALDEGLDGVLGNGEVQVEVALATYEMILDSGELSTRVLEVETGGSHTGTPTPSTTEEIYTSVDDVVYTLKNTRTIPSSSSGPITESTVSIASHSYRYVKIININTVAGAVDNRIRYREIYEKLKATATANFEVFDSNSDQWIEYISASEIGTIASGTNIAVQFGKSVSRIASDKIGFLLPSEFSILRVNFIVSAGRLTTGMSIIKVA